MKTNILVQYKGGGYAGCFWEWNFFYMNKDGTFHNIFSSGRAGIETEEQVKELFESDGAYYIYDLSKDEAIKEFSKECNSCNIAGVLKWFDNHNDPDVNFFVLCSECGEKITDYQELYLENWCGCGGIMSTADSLLCSECHSMGICDCCGEFVGEQNIYALYQNEPECDQARDNEYFMKATRELIDNGYSHICSYCFDYRMDQIKEDEQEQLRWQSWSIGTPDMFSDSMRWLWG